MKNKIFLILSVFLGITLFSCDDDKDYSINTNPLITENAVTTGSCDATANTLTLHGTAPDLAAAGQNSAAYTVGFYYGYSQDNLSSKITGELNGTEISAILSGLESNKTLYYQAFVTLQGMNTYKGDIKSAVTTNAKVTTGEASDITANTAVLSGATTEAPADATFGIVVSNSKDDIANGLIYQAEGSASSYKVTISGLNHNKTYYYAAYLDLGSNVVYGEPKEITTEDKTFSLTDDFVDLGLSVSWAKYNLGATSETELGGRFAYGDAYGCFTSIDPTEYQANGNIVEMLDERGQNITTLPTAEQFQELLDNTTQEVTEIDGVKGVKFNAKNGNSIFFPFAGMRNGNEITDINIIGTYATSDVDGTSYVKAMEIGSESKAIVASPFAQAISVRPIQSSDYTPPEPETETLVAILTSGIDNWESTEIIENGNKYVYEGDVNSGWDVLCFDFIEKKNEMTGKKATVTLSIDGTDITIDNSKIITGDLESKGNWRVEIYNKYNDGEISTKNDPPVDLDDLKAGHWIITLTVEDE